MKPIKKRTTQREISRRAQIGPDFLSHIIHGDRPCPRKVAVRLEAARRAYLDVVDFVVTNTKSEPNAVFAGSVPYLLLAGRLMAGWQLARSLLAAQASLDKGQDRAFMQAKIVTAQFYAEHVLSALPGMRDAIVDGAASVNELALESF